MSNLKKDLKNYTLGSFSDIYYVLELSTSAGKTYTIMEVGIKEVIASGIDLIVYSSPNHSSLNTEYDKVMKLYSDTCNIYKATSIGGNFNANIDTSKPVIILCHPTFFSASNNKKSDENILKGIVKSKKLKAVFFIDEAHKGTMMSDTINDINTNGKPAKSNEWYKGFTSIPTVSIFLLTATVKKNVPYSSVFKVISSYFDRDELCNRQAAVSKVVKYGVDKNSIGSIEDDHKSLFVLPIHRYIEYVNHLPSYTTIYELWGKKRDRLNFLTSKYNFPIAKPIMLIQGNATESTTGIYNNFADLKATLTLNDNKSIKQTHYKPESTSEIIDILNDVNQSHDSIIAINNIAESININTATMMVIDRRWINRQKDKAAQAEAPLVQVLGRMNRFPTVEDINTWDDVFAYKKTRLKEGISNDIINEWIDLVFKYEIHLFDTNVARCAVETFFSEHTYNPEEWEVYLKEKEKQASAAAVARERNRTFIYSGGNSKSKKSIDSRGNRCEVCEINKITQEPKCFDIVGSIIDKHTLNINEEIVITQHIITEEMYIKALQQDHILGHHNDDRIENKQTICPTMHNIKTILCGDNVTPAEPLTQLKNATAQVENA